MFLTSSHAAAAAAASLSFGNHCSKEHTVQTMTYGCLILDFRYQGGGRAVEMWRRSHLKEGAATVSWASTGCRNKRAPSIFSSLDCTGVQTAGDMDFSVTSYNLWQSLATGS